MDHLQHRRLKLDVVAAEEVFGGAKEDSRADATMSRAAGRDQVEFVRRLVP